MMAGVYEKISSAGYMQPNICKHLIKLSLVGNPMQLRHVGKKTRSKWPVEIQTKYQNGEEMWFKGLWMWLLVRDRLVWIFHCWSIRIFPHSLSRAYRERPKNENISSERQFSRRKWLADARHQRRMARLQGVQKSMSACRTHHTSKLMGSSSCSRSLPFINGSHWLCWCMGWWSGGIFSWHTLVLIKHHLIGKAYLWNVADHIHPLWQQYTHLLMASSRLTIHVTKHKSF